MHLLVPQGNALLGSQFVLAWVLHLSNFGPSGHRLGRSNDTRIPEYITFFNLHIVCQTLNATLTAMFHPLSPWRVSIQTLNVCFISDISYLQTILPPTTEQEFFSYLRNLNANDVIMYAVPEGSVVFPKVPLLRIEGPLPIVQLLETTLLTLVNYAR